MYAYRVVHLFMGTCIYCIHVHIDTAVIHWKTLTVLCICCTIKQILLVHLPVPGHLNTIQGYTLYHPLLNNSEAGRECYLVYTYVLQVVPH